MQLHPQGQVSLSKSFGLLTSDCSCCIQAHTFSSIRTKPVMLSFPLLAMKKSYLVKASELPRFLESLISAYLCSNLSSIIRDAMCLSAF